MNHDYEKELGRNTEHRSRRNPRIHGTMDDSGSRENLRREREIWEERKRAAAENQKELDIMGDATVRPLKRTQHRAAGAPGVSGQSGNSGTRMISGKTGTGRPRFSPEQPGTGGTRTVSAPTSSRGTRTASGQTSSRGARTAARQMAAGDSAGAAGSGVSGWQQALVDRKKKKRRRIITMIVAECFALMFIFGYGYIARRLNRIQRPTDFKIEEIKSNDLNQETVETMKGYWTIAIFGVDARNNAITKGTNADVNIICNINRDTGEIKLVSVFRDTYMNISEKGAYNKINQAYFLGGPEQAIQAMNRNLDLNISDYMTFNWKAVADAINVLGGVDIELSKAEFYYINSFITETVKATGIGSHQLKHAGMNHLDGVQAVAYGRLRLMDTDYARTERQRKVIAQAFEKAKKADLKTLNVLIGTVFPQVSTSIWVDDLVSNAKNISKFHLGETSGFPQARGDASMGKKGAVVVPQTLESNVIKLHEFLFGNEDYTPSQTVKDISAKIAADTGMYKEGKYVEKVGTEGGVIQPPKATKPAKTEKETDGDDTKESTKESSKGQPETDENGDPIEESTERETDEEGNPIGETSRENESGLRPTEPETDGNGNPIETTRYPRPGATQESSAQRPTSPGETEENSEYTRPGGTPGVTRPGTGTGNSNVPGGATDTPGTTHPGNNTGVGNVPGGTADTPGATRPGSGTGTGNVPGGSAGTGPGSSQPGGNTSTDNGSNSMAPGGATGTTGTGTRPGGGEGSIPVPPPASGGPGSQGSSGTGNNSGNGVVARPGM